MGRRARVLGADVLVHRHHVQLGRVAGRPRRPVALLDLDALLRRQPVGVVQRRAGARQRARDPCVGRAVDGAVGDRVVGFGRGGERVCDGECGRVVCGRGRRDGDRDEVGALHWFFLSCSDLWHVL